MSFGSSSGGLRRREWKCVCEREKRETKSGGGEIGDYVHVARIQY